jgi:hypothetical protein
MLRERWMKDCAPFRGRGLFGARAKDSEVSRIWQVNPDGSARRYTVRRDHELIRLLKERLGKASGLLDGTLDLIERTVPVERVWLDVTERGTAAVPQEADAETIGAAATLVDLLAQAGIPFETAVANVAMMDPFDKIADLQKRLTGGKRRGARR